MKLHGISCIVPCVCRFVSKFQTLGFPVGIVNTCVLLFPHAQPLVCSALAVLAWKGKVALPLVWACTLDLVVSIHNNLDLSPGLNSVRTFLFLIVHLWLKKSHCSGSRGKPFFLKEEESFTLEKKRKALLFKRRRKLFCFEKKRKLLFWKAKKRKLFF